MASISKKRAIEQFIHYKNLYQLNGQDKELLLDFISELFGIDKLDFIDAVNTEIERKQKVIRGLTKGASSSPV